MYKFVAIDIDGTLLDSYGELSQRNKEAIKNAIEKGVKIVLTSGRMPSSVKNFSEEIGANEYLIAGNGTMIYDMKKEKVIYENFIEKEKVLKIIKLLDENSIYYNLYTQDAVITKRLNFNTKFYYYENRKKQPDKQIAIHVMEDIYSYLQEKENIQVLKITICDDNKIVFHNSIQKLKQISDIEILEVEHMSKKRIKMGTKDIPIEYFYTEISNKNANKWTAIKYLIRKLKISKQEVMTIGDNMNDALMIQNAGLGVTLKGSALEAKKIGKIVVADHNSSGVAEAIEKYILDF